MFDSTPRIVNGRFAGMIAVLPLLRLYATLDRKTGSRLGESEPSQLCLGRIISYPATFSKTVQIRLVKRILAEREWKSVWQITFLLNLQMYE
jgi:hypothetical protein